MSSSQMLSVSEAIDLALNHHRSGELHLAENIYRQILAINPQQPDALHLLGVLATQTKHHEAAVDLLTKAIQVKNDIPDFYEHLGNAFWGLGRLSQAIDCYKHALFLSPDSAHLCNSLGVAFGAIGQLMESIAYLQKAIELNPNLLESHNNLGNAYWGLGQYEEATQCYQHALNLNPHYSETRNNLASMLKTRGFLTEALYHLEQNLVINPDDAKALSTIGSVLLAQGDAQAAVVQHRKALALDPDYTVAHSRLLFAMNYVPGYDWSTLFKEYQEFNRKHILPLANKSNTAYLNSRITKRRLKIAYLSPDFRRHSVSYFVEPLLAHHDHSQFEVMCYYNHAKSDEVTQRLQRYPDRWFNCAHLSHVELAEQIRSEQIDILIDLAGHTSNHRLLTFARKPAPVQVTYLGYPSTTGLSTIDYRITDNYVDPEGISEQFNAERLKRMPHCFFCYQPVINTPPINELPALSAGYITFGSFNSGAKLNKQILSIWAQILHALPTAKLLLKPSSQIMNDFNARQRLIAQFTALGISSERIILESYTPSTAYIQSYHQVDIALDTYPFNGGTTTCEALWMGVPVVTLVGNSHVSRMGLSILSTVGLKECITTNSESYIQTCLELANDLESLQKKRVHIREQMQHSPLMDAVSFTRQLEKFYREMWEEWVSSHFNL